MESPSRGLRLLGVVYLEKYDFFWFLKKCHNFNFLQINILLALPPVQIIHTIAIAGSVIHQKNPLNFHEWEQTQKWATKPNKSELSWLKEGVRVETLLFFALSVMLSEITSSLHFQGHMTLSVISHMIYGGWTYQRHNLLSPKLFSP